MSRVIAIQFNILVWPLKKPKQTTIKKPNPKLNQPTNKKVIKPPQGQNHETHQDCSYKENHKEAGKHHNQLKVWETGIKKYILDKWRSQKG